MNRKKEDIVSSNKTSLLPILEKYTSKSGSKTDGESLMLSWRQKLVEKGKAIFKKERRKKDQRKVP